MTKSESDASALPCSALRPDLAIIPMEDSIQLRAGDEEIYTIKVDCLNTASSILGHLDGTRNRSAILECVGNEYADLFDAVLEVLTANRLLVDAGGRDPIERYLSHFRTLRSDHDLDSIRIAAFGAEESTRLLIQNLADHKIQTECFQTIRELDNLEEAEATLAVCTWEEMDLHWVYGINDAMCRRETPCLFADLSHGKHATIGPFYIPGEGSCYRCLRQRYRENTAAYDELIAAEAHMNQTKVPLPGYGILPTFRYQVVGLVGSEVVAFFTRHRPLRTLNRTITIDFEQMTQWSEPAWKTPQCQSCDIDHARQA